ncbi:MAG TPA: prolyl aminopeptidase [Streptosporangiaceae bacterium]
MEGQQLYPEIEPYRTGMLQVEPGQSIWWEECGNPAGRPLLVVHGGPGGGCVPAMRRWYDPAAYRIILFDQRGCGRSVPHASDPAVSLAANTTWHLVADMEQLRTELGVDQWVLSGGSWGSALALAYAQRHPDRVAAMVLRAIFTLRESEIRWTYHDGASQLLPERWAEFRGAIPAAERGDLVAAYRRRFESPDRQTRVSAAQAWTRWETAGMLAEPEPDVEALFAGPDFAVAFARIESHYVAHRGFLAEGQLLREAGRLRGIPAMILQGRYDLCTPPVTAWDLHRAWPEAGFQIIDDDGHRLTGSAAQMIAATDRFARL